MPKGNFLLYLTHSDEDKKWQIVCSDAGYTVIPPGSSYPPNKELHPEGFKSVTTGRTLNEYQLIYISKGKGRLTVEDKEYTVTAGSVFLIFPGVMHSYEPDKSTGWCEYWIGFSGSYPDNLRKAGVISPERSLYQIGLHDTLLYIFNKIFDQVREQKPGYQIRNSADTICLLAEVVSLAKNQEQKSGNDELVDKIKFILEEHLYDSIDIEFIADEMKMNKVKLQNVFKSYTGMTPYQYFLNLKINKAKEWLHFGNYSIKEIAYKLSFKDPCYFTRLFTKKTGVSPSQWSVYH
ncbi:MAG: AraC family transcriptional regulator [Spirochaetales bacterium]|nr:AraC family transcriptional regulator [Spirochaetales bacterium]